MVCDSDLVMSRLSGFEGCSLYVVVSSGIGGLADLVKDRRCQSAEGGAGL
jgi:hypothetical protein